MDAGLEPVTAEAPRLLALLLDLHRGLQRILQHAGEIAGLHLIHASAADDCATAVNRCPDNRRGLNYAIKNNCEPMVHMRFSNLTECLRTFVVEPECDFPSFLTVACSGLRNMVAAKISFLFDEQPLLDWLSALNFLFISFNPVFWRNHFFSVINRFEALTIIGIHQAELQLSDA